MYCFLKPFRCSSRAHRSLPSFRPQLEQLDERLVLSTLSSAISIQHQGWTERDWYAVDQASTRVLAFYCPAGSHITGYEFAAPLVDQARRRSYAQSSGGPVRVDFVCQGVTETLRQSGVLN